MALENDTPPVRPITLFALPEIWSDQPVPLRQYLPVFGVLLLLLAGQQIWAQGIFVLLVGITLWRKPPRYALTRQVDAFSIAALALILFSFLPYLIYNIIPLRWFKQGRWRGQIEQAEISSSFTYTPQPFLTLEMFMLVLAVLALVALLIHAPQYNAQRWRFALVLTLGLTLIAALGLLGGVNGSESALIPALHSVIFPNFATATAIGSLLAFALMLSALRERWIAGVPLMALCLLILATALVKSGSGLWSWTALTAVFWAMVQVVQRRRVHGLIRTAAILVFVTVATLVILGNTEGSGWVLKSESAGNRIARQYDSATVIMQQSAMGVGLGNYAYVFPFYQKRSLDQGEVTSPSNDWLLLTVETGLLGLGIFGLLSCALLFACFGKSRKQAGPVRLAGICALLVFFAGTILQTPAHYLGTVVLAVLCLQIARPSRADDKKRSMYPRWLWKTQSVLLILTGALWLSASLLNGAWQSDIATAKAMKGIALAIEENDIEGAESSAARGLRITPLAWEPYMELGKAHILIHRDLIAAKADMNRTLVLIPGRAELPLQQGILWLPHSTQEAEQSFRHALERHTDTPEALYKQLVAAAAPDRYFQQPLARLSQTNPQVRYAYLLGVNSNQFNAALAEELRNDASLQRFSEEQRRELITRWAREGNTRNAIRYLEQNPDIISYPWFLRGLALARLGSFKEATDLFSNSLPRAQIPSILTPASRRAEMPVAGFRLPTQASEVSPQQTEQPNGSLNHLQATALLQQQLDNQQWEAAQETATRLLAASNAPAYAAYWSGWLYHREGKYREAWPLLEQYARHYLERRWEERAAELRGELIATPSLSKQAFERWGQIEPTPAAATTQP